MCPGGKENGREHRRELDGGRFPGTDRFTGHGNDMGNVRGAMFFVFDRNKPDILN